MYPADFRYSKEHEWVKMEGASGTSELPITRRVNWATSFSWNFRKSARN